MYPISTGQFSLDSPRHAPHATPSPGPNSSALAPRGTPDDPTIGRLRLALSHTLRTFASRHLIAMTGAASEHPAAAEQRRAGEATCVESAEDYAGAFQGASIERRQATMANIVGETYADARECGLSATACAYLLLDTLEQQDPLALRHFSAFSLVQPDSWTADIAWPTFLLFDREPGPQRSCDNGRVLRSDNFVDMIWTQRERLAIVTPTRGAGVLNCNSATRHDDVRSMLRTLLPDWMRTESDEAWAAVELVPDPSSDRHETDEQMALAAHENDFNALNLGPFVDVGQPFELEFPRGSAPGDWDAPTAVDYPPPYATFAPHTDGRRPPSYVSDQPGAPAAAAPLMRHLALPRALSAQARAAVADVLRHFAAQDLPLRNTWHSTEESGMTIQGTTLASTRGRYLSRVSPGGYMAFGDARRDHLLRIGEAAAQVYTRGANQAGNVDAGSEEVCLLGLDYLARHHPDVSDQFDILAFTQRPMGRHRTPASDNLPPLRHCVLLYSPDDADASSSAPWPAGLDDAARWMQSRSAHYAIIDLTNPQAVTEAPARTSPQTLRSHLESLLRTAGIETRNYRIDVELFEPDWLGRH